MRIRTSTAVVALLSASLATSAPWRVSADLAPRPAFLDSPTEVVLPLEPFRSADELAGRFKVVVDGKDVLVTKAEPTGDPEMPRMKPRTPGRIVLPGTLQSALGGKDWDPDGESTQMEEVRPGVHELVVELPRGVYEYKIARNGSWGENYGQGFEAGGQNITLRIPNERMVVKFVVDLNRRTIRNSVEHPGEVTAPARAPQPLRPVGPLKYPSARLTLAHPIRTEQVSAPIEVVDAGTRMTVFARKLLSRPEFSYAGRLGSFHAPAKTEFKVWSPVARKASVLLYSSPTEGTPRRIPMTKSQAGVWTVHVDGDLHGTFYQYEFESYGQTRVTQDINCFAASPDSKRSMVVDLSRTNPDGWPSATKRRHASQTEAVIYEIHVRDFTVDPAGGTLPANRGKYAGLGQAGTKSAGGHPTGLDYLAWLGVTDIHLLPIHNFLSSPGEYTWGYATNLFNVPEETYSRTPNDPVGVIREVKHMISSMHRAGLRVVLDVVYNHTWPPEGDGSAFQQTVPYYYFHTNDRGDILNESGVGNAVDDSKPMVRKFIRDSLVYWLDEYKVDGFRFDLLAIHHEEAVRDYGTTLRAKRPDVLLYGEPWTAAGPNRFPKGAQRGSGVAVFNDNFRGAFRGELDGAGAGFATGGGGDAWFLQKSLSGWIDSATEQDGLMDSPQETVNYVSAHDNLTLWDRFGLTLTGGNASLVEPSVRLAGAAVLLSQGVPFLEGGVELGRTKGGNHNSYNAGDAVNQYDWKRAEAFRPLASYYRDLIAVRHAHPGLRLASAKEVRERMRFLPASATPPKSVAYSVTQEGEELLVAFHGGTAAARMALPAGTWNRVLDAKGKGSGTASGSVELAPLTAYVFSRSASR